MPEALNVTPRGDGTIENWSLVVCENDVRPGGAYRFVGRNERGGPEMGWGGVYRDVVKPRRFVATERFDKRWYAGEAVVTLDLAERGVNTILTLTLAYESRQARDAVLASPMKEGIAESYDRLAEVLASMPAS